MKDGIGPLSFVQHGLLVRLGLAALCTLAIWAAIALVLR